MCVEGFWPTEGDAKGMTASQIVLGDHSTCCGAVHQVRTGL